jgi:hypothetical protein
MAHPTETYVDYSAFIKGILRPLPDRRNSRTKRKEMREKLNKEVLVSDEQLKAYINNLIRDDLRVSSFKILSEAKNSKHAVMAYYNFVNAYHLHKAGDDSYGNIACMSIDLAKKLLKETNRSCKQGKNRFHCLKDCCKLMIKMSHSYHAAGETNL